MKKVSVIGLGYIGLPTAIVVADAGYTVSGFDIDQKKVDAINKKDPTIHEPHLVERLSCAIDTGLFHATTTLEEADFFVIAVPTPITAEKKADLSYVWAAGESIATVLKHGDVVILESTCSVGTTQELAQRLYQKTGLKPSIDFFIGFCPERVLPGHIFYELVHNSRVVGGIDPLSAEKIAAFYKLFVKGEIVITDAKTAEMVKLVENSARDVEIAFAHQVASMAYKSGIDPYALIELANKHPRVNILTPRCGVGGHCIAVDPWFLIETFPEETALLKTAREVNDQKPHEVIAVVDAHIKSFTKTHKKKCTIAIFGLTYKPNVDDLRESPALEIAQHLAQRSDIELIVHDPYIDHQKAPQALKSYVATYDHAVACADMILLLVAHDLYKDMPWSRMPQSVIDFSGLRVKSSVHVNYAAIHTTKAEHAV